MTLDTAEFIRRFLIHVLPKGQHRIRYYVLKSGLLRYLCRETLDLYRETLGLCKIRIHRQKPTQNQFATQKRPR